MNGRTAARDEGIVVGLLIGLAAAMLALLNGRVAGIRTVRSFARESHEVGDRPDTDGRFARLLGYRCFFVADRERWNLGVVQQPDLARPRYQRSSPMPEMQRADEASASVSCS